MKRAITSAFAVVLLCLLSAGVILYAHGQLTARGEDVSVTETTLFGDKREAEGIALETKICSSGRVSGSKLINWDVSSHLSGGSLKTDIRCFLDDTEFSDNDASGIQLREALYLSYGASDLLLEYADNQINFPRKIFDAVAGKTKAGKKHTEKVRLSDYLSCYPVKMDIGSEVPYGTSCLPDGSLVDYGSYFGIPIDDDIRLKVTVSKNAQGTPTDFSAEPVGETYLSLESASAACRDADCIYTALTGYYLGGTLKEIPEEKCGIHRIPLKSYKTTELNSFDYVYADMENAQLVYPLESKQDIVKLEIDGSGKNLLLFTWEHGDIFLSVIDISTMICRQKLLVMSDISPTGEALPDFQVRQFQNSLLLLNESREFSYLLIDSSVYRLETQGRLSQIFPKYFTAWNLSHAYDGERFAIAFQEGIEFHHSYSAYLMVYRKSELVYAGCFENSLEQALHYHNDWDPINPLAIVFEEASK